MSDWRGRERQWPRELDGVVEGENQGPEEGEREKCGSCLEKGLQANVETVQDHGRREACRRVGSF